jgi:hypothetical protein
MAKPKGEKPGESAAKKDNGEGTVSGYFRRVFAEDPRLLDTRSNDELFRRWLADNPGETEVPERVRQILSNVKSVLRKKARRGGRRERAREEAAGAPPRPRPRHATSTLAALEEHIDDALTIAKVIDREGLQSVISLLRRARNEVVWKQGQ